MILTEIHYILKIKEITTLMQKANELKIDATSFSFYDVDLVSLIKLHNLLMHNSNVTLYMPGEMFDKDRMLLTYRVADCYLINFYSTKTQPINHRKLNFN
jgi:hypothetical protein